MVLVWTRDTVAREAIALALSRVGVDFEPVKERCELVRRTRAAEDEVTLVLGPSFSVDEARQIGEEFGIQHGVTRVVVLEDLTRPLPCRTIICDVPTQVLTLPLRIRPLLYAVGAR